MSGPNRCLNDVEALHRLYVSVYGDAPADDARSRFGRVLAGDRP